MANMGHTRLVLLAPGHGDENDDLVHVDNDCDDDDGVDDDASLMMIAIMMMIVMIMIIIIPSPNFWL